MTNLRIEHNIKFTTASLGCFLRIPLTPKNLALANILSTMQNTATRTYPFAYMRSRALSDLYDMSVEVLPEVFGNQIVMYYTTSFVEPDEVLNPDYTYQTITDTFFDIVKKPLFEQRLFDIAKERIYNVMERYYDFSGHVAMRNFIKNWYRAQPEFSELIWGDQTEIEQASLEDVRQFYRQMTHSPAICLGQARDADTLTDLVQPHLDWSGFSDDFAVSSLAIPAKKDYYQKVDDQNGLQAQILMGYGFDSQTNTNLNQFGGLLLDSYLAGDEYSELFLKIREKLGAAYAVSADNYLNNSLFLISTSVDKEKVVQVEKIITNSIKKVQQGDVDLELFARAKRGLLHHYQVSRDDQELEIIQMLANSLRNREMTFEKRINYVKRFSVDDMVKFSQKLFLNERYCLL